MSGLEIVGSIASVAQLAGTVYAISKTLYEVGNALSNAPSDIKDLAGDLENFSEELHLYARLLDKKHYDDQFHRLTARIIGECATICTKIDRVLRKLRSGSVWARVKWLYKEKEIVKLLTRLRDLKFSLLSILQLMKYLKADHEIDAIGGPNRSLIEGSKEEGLSQETVAQVEATRKKLAGISIAQEHDSGESSSEKPGTHTNERLPQPVEDAKPRSAQSIETLSGQTLIKTPSQTSGTEAKATAVPSEAIGSSHISAFALPTNGIMQNPNVSVQSFHSAVSHLDPDPGDERITSVYNPELGMRADDGQVRSKGIIDNEKANNLKADFVSSAMKHFQMSKEEAEAWAVASVARVKLPPMGMASLREAKERPDHLERKEQPAVYNGLPLAYLPAQQFMQPSMSGPQPGAQESAPVLELGLEMGNSFNTSPPFHDFSHLENGSMDVLQDFDFGSFLPQDNGQSAAPAPLKPTETYENDYAPHDSYAHFDSPWVFSPPDNNVSIGSDISLPIEQGFETTNWNEPNAQQMAPPEINIEFAPASRTNSFEPPKTSLDKDDLTVSAPRSRSRALSDPDSSSSTKSGTLCKSSEVPSNDPSEALSLPLTNRRRQSTSSLPEREHVISLVHSQYQNAAPEDGNLERVQKPPQTFQCPLCHRTFTRSYNLRSHVRTHYGGAHDGRATASSSQKTDFTPPAPQSFILWYPELPRRLWPGVFRLLARKDPSPSPQQLKELWWRAFAKLSLEDESNCKYIHGAWLAARRYHDNLTALEAIVPTNTDGDIARTLAGVLEDCLGRLSDGGARTSLHRIGEILKVMRSSLDFHIGGFVWTCFCQVTVWLIHRHLGEFPDQSSTFATLADLATLIARYNVMESMYHEWPGMTLEKKYEDSLINLCTNVLQYLDKVMQAQPWLSSDPTENLASYAVKIAEADSACRGFTVTIVPDVLQRDALHGTKRTIEIVEDDEDSDSDSDSTLVEKGSESIPTPKRVKV